MFCSNCGSKLDSDSVFCTSCGAKQAAETSSSNGININISKEDTGKVFKGVLDSLKNPSNSTLILKENLTSLQAKILFFTTLLLIPIINLATIKSTITNFFISFAKFGAALEGQAVSSFEISAAKSMLNAALGEAIPFGTIFLYGVLFLALLFGVIFGIMFLFFKINKESLNFNDALCALILPSLTLLVSAILTPLFLSLGFVLTIICSLILTSIFVITTYTGFKALMDNKTFLPYAVSIAIVIGYAFSYYIQVKMVFDSIMSEAMKSSFF
ncbi:MAG: zinc-ribbon domain-containing protein [Clostridium sp.]|uniref:zinc-ribbon domain-containing protein n=1 Tax=Clostridium sp. TaxID=1506 RepID=UPI003F3C08ED